MPNSSLICSIHYVGEISAILSSLYFLSPFSVIALTGHNDWSVPAGHMQNIDTFVAQAMETLSVRPENIEEIGEANVKYGELLAKKPEVLELPPLFMAKAISCCSIILRGQNASPALLFLTS